MFVNILFHHEENEKSHRIINIVSIVQKLIYKHDYKSNVQKFQVLMKLEICHILQLFLNFRDSEP